ncbi:MAG: hypothetical protein GTO40_27545, partial [Deltaproteobacteria bacterium]|nr:hypothetical protein [Deltaproteobacteria bacterium]
SKTAKGETCAAAIRAAIEPGEILSFAKLIERIKQRGRWKNATIWEHLMALVVNLPPARLHWPKLQPFLFLHGDGRYELYQDTEYDHLRDAGSVENRDHSRGELIEDHLRLDRVLDLVDPKRLPNEGFAQRVMRLRDSSQLPKNIACMMLTVNALRNIVVHEGFVMGPHEEGVVNSAMAAIEEWSRKKSK